MDPNATLKAFYAACEQKQWVDATVHQRHLVSWLRLGGFEPSWSDEQARKDFLAWTPPADAHIVDLSESTEEDEDDFDDLDDFDMRVHHIRETAGWDHKTTLENVLDAIMTLPNEMGSELGEDILDHLRAIADREKSNG